MFASLFSLTIKMKDLIGVKCNFNFSGAHAITFTSVGTSTRTTFKSRKKLAEVRLLAISFVLLHLLPPYDGLVKIACLTPIASL